jgi:hypothetical protein
LDIGRMDDGVEQQTQRVYENMAFLALDLLARIIAMRIDAGPPCMGTSMSRTKTRHKHLFLSSPTSGAHGQPSAGAPIV